MDSEYRTLSTTHISTVMQFVLWHVIELKVSSDWYQFKFFL